MFKVGHIAKAIAFVWAIAFAKYSIWAKHLSYLRHAKIDFVFALQKIFAKKPLEINLKYSRNKMMWIIGHPKNRVKKSKNKTKQKKTNKNKKKNKKHQVYTKRDDVDNRPYCKGCSHCMGYCLCKILNLSQTFKSPKTCQNRFCIHIGEILEKKKKRTNKQTKKGS